MIHFTSKELPQKLRKQAKKGTAGALAATVAATSALTALPANTLAAYDVLESEAPMEGEGTEASPYLIRTKEQLNWMRNELTAHYKLMSEIDLAGYNWEPIGNWNTPFVDSSFSGSFDGNGFIIRNLTIDSSVNLIGFFGMIGEDGGVTNASFENATVTLSIPSSDNYIGNYIGVIAGINVGKIQKSYSTGKIESPETTTDLFQSIRAGGIAGENTGHIENSFSNVDVLNYTSNLGVYEFLGGLVGNNLGYYDGLNRTDGIIKNSFSTGQVIDNDTDAREYLFLGGLVGYAFYYGEYAYITNSFWDKGPNGDRIIEAGGKTAGIGLSTDDMQKRSTFEDIWDLESVWEVNEGSYPVLIRAPIVSDEIDDRIVEANDGTITLDVSSHIVEPTGEPLTVTAVSSDTDIVSTAVNGTVLQLTPHRTGPVTITVTAVDGQGQSITDSFALTVVDTIAPTIGSAVIEHSAPNVVALTVSEAVYADNADGFTITVDDASVAIADISGSETNELTLTLVSNVVHGRAVKLQYEAEAGSVRDLAGNALASVAAQDVVNRVEPRVEDDDSDDDDNDGGNRGNSGGGGGSSPSGTPTAGTDIEVDGQIVRAGTAATSTVNGQTVTTLTIDPAKLEERLEAAGQRAVITIPVNTQADVVVGELNGQMVKSMEGKQAVVEIKTEKASYTLPAGQINIDAISGRIGENVVLQDIRIQIEIAAPTTDTVQLVENSAAAGQFTLVAPPVNFTVRGIYGDETIEITEFTAYVERTIAIPEGVDPDQITTGVVVDPDGTVRHVPTKIVEIDGTYYAVINSLTNSTYTAVWHPVEFDDVERHWAEEAVNDMGSRMVIQGVGDGRFAPDQDVTRAEFAAIIVRGLGLKPESGAAPFSDVKASDWHNSVIAAAHEHDLINGFEDGTFRPNDKITREQAMTIIAKAMEISDLKAKLPSRSAGGLLSAFEDANLASEWAKNSIADSLQAGVVTGRSGHELAPGAYITRAEVAVILKRFLQKSELI